MFLSAVKFLYLLNRMVMYMQVVIRVDGSTVIGSGHVMRCLTLAKQLRKRQGAEVAFVMRDLPGNLINLVQAEDFRVMMLPRAEKNPALEGYEQWLTVPVEQDAKETLAAILGYTDMVDRVVVDSYALDIRWEAVLRPITKKIMAIDDLANRRHDCDILLDQNFYLDMDSRYQGLVPEQCEMLLGPGYALLREEFYEARRHLRQRDGKIRNILVFYGGSDLTDETSKALRALVLLHDELAAKKENVEAIGHCLVQSGFTVDVIVGQSNQHRDAIENFCRQYYFIHYHCQISNMAAFMNKADIMLGAGGLTTGESLFLQLPSIVTAVADNQIQACHDYAEAGIIYYLGLSKDITVSDILSALKDICEHGIYIRNINAWWYADGDAFKKIRI